MCSIVYIVYILYTRCYTYIDLARLLPGGATCLSATCLIRPRCFVCAVGSVKDRRNLKANSPLLKKASVSQVVSLLVLLFILLLLSFVLISSLAL